MCAGSQFGQAGVSQELRVDEDVWSIFAPGEKAEAAPAIEPFNLRALERACRCHDYARASCRHLRGINGRGVVYGKNADDLQTARALQYLHRYTRAFIGDIMPIAPQTTHMHQYVRHPIVGHNEAVTLGWVEPLDHASDFDNASPVISDTYAASCALTF